MQNTEVPPYDAFHSKLRSCNPLEPEYTDCVNLIKSGMTTDQVVIKLKLSKPPPTVVKNYHYLQQIWKQDQMSSFRDFLRWYNNKDIVPTLKAFQKMMAVYHDKDINFLKLGCTLQSWLTFVYTNQPMQISFFFTEEDNKLLEKNSRRHRWWSTFCFYTQSSC